MRKLVCTYCGYYNSDPGGDLDTYKCGHCGHHSLVRPVPQPVDRVSQLIAGGMIGFALGACFLGWAGMILGAVIGGFLGWRHNGG